MPELPEVERARALIEEHALGRQIAAVDDTDTYVTRPHVPGELSDALVGAMRTALAEPTLTRSIGEFLSVEVLGRLPQANMKSAPMALNTYGQRRTDGRLIRRARN